MKPTGRALGKSGNPGAGRCFQPLPSHTDGGLLTKSRSAVAEKPETGCSPFSRHLRPGLPAVQGWRCAGLRHILLGIGVSTSAIRIEPSAARSACGIIPSRSPAGRVAFAPLASIAFNRLRVCQTAWRPTQNRARNNAGGGLYIPLRQRQRHGQEVHGVKAGESDDAEEPRRIRRAGGTLRQTLSVSQYASLDGSPVRAAVRSFG